MDAVEIDPRLQQIGAQLHPAKPYDDPRVHVHINDGRAFLERTHTKYDLVVLALPDSLTLVSGASNLRLESYLFTRQAFEAARDHLAPNGAFVMYNYYRTSWLIDRFAGTLEDIYGHALYDAVRHERGRVDGRDDARRPVLQADLAAQWRGPGGRER